MFPLSHSLPFPQHHRGLRLALCAALSLATLAWPASVSAQVADTARAAAIDAANARAIELFQALSEAKSDSARDQAISALHAMARSKAPEEHEAIGRYGISAFMTSADAKKQAEFTEHRAILAKVIPLMFGTLTGDVQDKAWWVLINVQNSASPPPKRALWDLWWREKGKAMYVPVPAAVPVADSPTPARPSPPPSSSPTPNPKPRPPTEQAKKKK